MSAGFFSDRFGRRRVLFFCAILYALSAILSAIPQSFGQFIAARILSGIAIGVSSMICPVYIAEIAPAKWRGRLGTLFQFGIVAGIFLTLFINRWIQQSGDAAWNTDYGWRWMLAAEAVPALIFLFLLFPIPESPRWLIQAGREEEARRILSRVGGAEHAAAEIAAVKDVLQQEEGSLAELFSRHYRLPLLIAFVLDVGAQFSGINSIMYYSTEIFKNATGNANAAFTSSVWIGLINFLATFGAILFVDKAGRKPLLAPRQRRSSRRSAHCRIDIPAQPPIAGAAVVRPALHLGLRHRRGAAAVDRLLGNFPRQAARARHVRFRLLRLGRLPAGRPDLSALAESDRPRQDLLHLRRLFGHHVPLRSLPSPGNKRPHLGGN